MQLETKVKIYILSIEYKRSLQASTPHKPLDMKHPQAQIYLQAIFMSPAPNLRLPCTNVSCQQIFMASRGRQAVGRC